MNGNPIFGRLPEDHQSADKIRNSIDLTVGQESTAANCSAFRAVHPNALQTLDNVEEITQNGDSSDDFDYIHTCSNINICIYM
jgi:hypothetical protein